MQKPKSQEFDNAFSHLLEIICVHSCKSTRGAFSCRLWRFTLSKVCISGMPVQYLKQKAKATPKYHGSNWSSIWLLTPATYFLQSLMLLPDNKSKFNLASSKETLQLKADFELHGTRVISHSLRRGHTTASMLSRIAVSVKYWRISISGCKVLRRLFFLPLYL